MENGTFATLRDLRERLMKTLRAISAESDYFILKERMPLMPPSTYFGGTSGKLSQTIHLLIISALSDRSPAPTPFGPRRFGSVVVWLMKPN